MEKHTKWYYFINIAVLVITVLVFFYSYRNVTRIFYGMDIFDIVVLLATVFSVHFIKAGRLYFAFYGSGFERKTYFKTYCKVTPVGMVMPLKLGELFRMYCYGRQLRNIIKGIIIILLDRFMDTAALVSVIGLVWIFSDGKIPAFIYLLLMFLVFILLIYFVFSDVYQYWKRYLLHAKATENRLWALKMLETLNRIYQDTAGVVKGKGLILYFMSLAAWGAEIVSISLLNGLSEDGKRSKIISDYLTAAMGRNQSVQLNRFVFVSVVIFIVMYAFVKVMEIFRGKRVNKA